MVEIRELKLRLRRLIVIITLKPPNGANRQKRRRIRWGLLAILITLIAGLYRLGVAVGAVGFVIDAFEYLRQFTAWPGGAFAAVVVGATAFILGCRFSEGRDPRFSKPFPPDLSTRLSARHAPSGCPKQPISVYTFAS